MDVEALVSLIFEAVLQAFWILFHVAKMEAVEVEVHLAKVLSPRSIQLVFVLYL
jgi:hypothetical protein